MTSHEAFNLVLNSKHIDIMPIETDVADIVLLDAKQWDILRTHITPTSIAYDVNIIRIRGNVGNIVFIKAM